MIMDMMLLIRGLIMETTGRISAAIYLSRVDTTSMETVLGMEDRTEGSMAVGGTAGTVSGNMVKVRLFLV